MTKPPLIREISLAKVDFDAHPFKIAKSENLVRLRESLATVGLLSPPRVQSLEGGWWRVITGWKRLKAAAQLGWGEIPAVVLGRETSEAQLLLLYLGF
jgi:ParB-like chromosome segregation protein Spo0J